MNRISFVPQRSFFSLFRGWNTGATIYPPAASAFTTKNRIYPNYITRRSELSDLILIKQPLILNFTVQADALYNRLTSQLFDVISDAGKYPLGDYEIHVANISSDSPEAREIMMTYGVNKLPALVRLEKQLVVDAFFPSLDSVTERDVVDWLKTFR